MQPETRQISLRARRSQEREDITVQIEVMIVQPIEPQIAGAVESFSLLRIAEIQEKVDVVRIDGRRDDVRVKLNLDIPGKLLFQPNCGDVTRPFFQLRIGIDTEV